MRNIVFSLLFLLAFSFNSLSNDVILKIENNWNKIESMSGSFLQIDADGNNSNGKFYFLKPYLSKFEYENKPENIITNESLLRLVDKDGYQIESYAIGGNILKKLLSNEIDIQKEFNVEHIDNDGKTYELLFKPKNEKTDYHAKLFFDINTLDLKKWEIYDEFNNKTVLEFTKIKKNIFISQNLFVVKYNNN